MRSVLITGARAPVALDLARSFVAAGWRVHLADSIAPWSARLTGIAPFHGLPPPRFAFGAFSEALRTMIDAQSIDLVLPTCEEVFYVAAAGERLGFADKLFAPPLETLRRLHSKVDFAELAQTAGAAAPQTWRITSDAERDAFRARSRDLVFKPEFSRFASHTLVGPAPGRLDLIRARPDCSWAVQEHVEGEEVCVWSAAIAGELVAYAAYRPAWRMGRSASFYFEADHDPNLLDLARSLAGRIGATGQFSYDVIRTADGRLAPLECNPRSVSGLHLFGADPVLARALAGEAPALGPPLACAHLGPAMWLFAGPSALATGQVARFRADLARSRNVLKGPAAAAGALLDASHFAVIGLSRGRSASGQSTDDIEWNGGPIG